MKNDYLRKYLKKKDIKLKHGDVQGAIDVLSRAVKQYPLSSRLWFELGEIKLLQNLLEEAISFFSKAVELESNYAKALSRLSVALYRSRRLSEAVECCHMALKLEPNNVNTLCILAMALLDQGIRHEAVKYSEKAIIVNPDFIKAHILNGAIRASLGQYELALESYRNATALSPSSLDAIAGEADSLIKLGEFDHAHDIVLDNIKNGKNNPALAVVFATVSRSIGEEEQAIQVLEKTLNQPGLSHAQQRQLHFSAGELYDRISEYDRAFEHFRVGNNLSQKTYMEANDKQAFDKTIDVFTRNNLKSCPVARRIDIAPIFIVGMPRSGTSLLEKVLSCHTDVYPGGELPNMPEIIGLMPAQLNTETQYPDCFSLINEEAINHLSCVYYDKLRDRIKNEKFVTDKLPHNYMLLGLIEKLFPHARIIHCYRNALDTCLSNYFQDFSSTITYTNNLNHIASHYLNYRKLMNHWKNTLTLSIYDFKYEDLINDQEQATRSVLEFCGLDWEPECLTFYKSRYIARTASIDQVKQPIHNRSINRWCNYEKYINPLINKLHEYI